MYFSVTKVLTASSSINTISTIEIHLSCYKNHFVHDKHKTKNKYIQKYRVIFVFFFVFQILFYALSNKNKPGNPSLKKMICFLKIKFLGNQVLEIFSIPAFAQLSGSLQQLIFIDKTIPECNFFNASNLQSLPFFDYFHKLGRL